MEAPLVARASHPVTPEAHPGAVRNRPSHKGSSGATATRPGATELTLSREELPEPCRLPYATATHPGATEAHPEP